MQEALFFLKFFYELIHLYFRKKWLKVKKVQNYNFTKVICENRHIFLTHKLHGKETYLH